VPFERLLDEEAFDGTALSRVLAAARAPARPDELVGLESARVAFLERTAAQRHRAARGSSGARSLAGRLIAAKAIAALSGATLIGGVAYAASSGVLTSTPSGRTAPRTSAANVAPRPVGTAGYPYGPIWAISSHAAGVTTDAGQPQPTLRRHPAAGGHPSHPPAHTEHPHPTGPASTPRASRAPAPPSHGHRRPHRAHPSPTPDPHPTRPGKPS
jgi:hypothetical protein